MRKSNLLIWLAVFTISSCRNRSELLPNTNMNHFKEYHCWPYEVTVYSIENLQIDSTFFRYPLKSYFWGDSKYQITTWEKYADFDTSTWAGMIKVLSQCEDDQSLSDQIIKGREIYYAGSYQYTKNRHGIEMKRYEEVAFIDVKERRLHLFKNINKVY